MDFDLVLRWFRLCFEHLQRHWQVHIYPLLALLIGVTAIGLVTTVCVVLAILVSAVGGSIDETLGGIGMVVMMVILFPVLIAVSLLLQPVFLVHVDVVMRTMRGEPDAKPDWSKMRTRGPAAIGASLVVMLITLAGVMFCYFPGLVLGGLLMPTIPLLASHPELGPIEAIQRAFALTKPRWIEVGVMAVVLFLGVGFIAQIPLLGAAIMMAVMATMASVVTLDLSRAT
jgi:hypothetical protein